MQIEYNKQQEVFIIKDGLKSQYLLVKFVMGILLANSIIILITAAKTGFGTLDYLWLVFGFIAIYTLYNLIFKKSTISEIAVKEIAYVRIRNIRDRSYFALVLKNGKVRSLAVFSDDKEEQKMIQLFNKAGIPKN